MIEKKDEDYATIHINTIDSLVQPQSFYDLVRARAISETMITRNRGEYVSKTGILLGYWLHRLTNGNDEKLWRLIAKMNPEKSEKNR